MRIELDGGSVIELTGTPPNGQLESNLRSKVDPEDADYNRAIDGMESLILALYCEGIDLSTPQMHSAIETAVEAITNNLL